MEDQKTQQLKANYNQLVLSIARNVYLKHQECVRDLNESKIREEDKNAIKLHMIRMLISEQAKGPNVK